MTSTTLLLCVAGIILVGLLAYLRWIRKLAKTMANRWADENIPSRLSNKDNEKDRS